MASKKDEEISSWINEALEGKALGGVSNSQMNTAWGTYIATPTESNAPKRVTGTGGSANDFSSNVYKAVIPGFLYKPHFGYPMFKDIPEIRRLAESPYVTMITNTVCNEIASLDWKVVPKYGQDVPDEIIEKTKNWLYNPNSNEESLNEILRKLVRDILEVDAGVVVKVRNLKDEFVEMYVRDGGTFTKNPSIYGIMPIDNAYFQYGWLTGARPIPFNRNEIAYFMLNPRADSIYGRSPVETLMDVIQLLVYGVDSNLDYFRDNAVPKGVFEMIGAEQGDIEAFGKAFQETMKKKDAAGNWRRYWHKMPIINTDGKFERIAFSNVELELIQQQQWFTKLVWACFNVNPSELGFTEDSNRATEVVQSSVYKRKLIRPIVETIEYHFNTEILPDLPWLKEYGDKIEFQFDRFDLEEELGRRKMHWEDIKNGLRTVNEVREELDFEPIEGGDELRGGSFSGNFEGFGKNPFDNNSKPENPEKNPENEKVDDELKKKSEEKALMIDTPLTPKEFEEMAKPKYLESYLDKQIESILKQVKKDIVREAGQNVIQNVKALDLKFIKSLVEKMTLVQTAPIVANTVKSAFYKGNEKVEKELNRNFLPNQEAIDFVKSYTFDNVKNLGEELKNDLRQELQRGLMNGENPRQISKRVDKVMKVGKNRSEMIARTETNRAENLGSLTAWRQSGLGGHKEWLAEIDDRTSPVCKALNGKKIPLDAKFKYKGKEFDAPPAHPSCRSTIIFYPE